MNITKRFAPFLRVGFSLCTLLAVASSAFGSGTVTNLTQANLEAALAGGGTVLFAVSGTLPLTNTITISQNTLMDANGQNVTISGGNSVRLFIVATNVGFQINGLTLANGQVVGTNGINGTSTNYATSGQSVFGGGIWNQGGNLTLVNCTLTNNYAVGGNAGTNGSTIPPILTYGGDASGGCIYSIGGTVNLTNCVLVGNGAAGGLATFVPFIGGGTTESGGAFGGALYLQGTGYFQNVTFLNDKATAGAIPALTSNAGVGGPALGGAVFATNSTVFVCASSAVSNSVTGGGVTNVSGNITTSNGSGRGMGGALFFSQDCFASIQRLTAVGNSATGGKGTRYHPGGGGMGGAIFSAAPLQFSDCTFSLNQSIGGGGSIAPGVGLGGAIYSTNAVKINACTFDHNNAIGASASLETAQAWNGAQGAGGAVWSSGLLAMTNCTCTANSAKGGVAGGGLSIGVGGDGSGGALAVPNGTAYLVNVTMAGNRADGGAKVFYPPSTYYGPYGPSQGGEIYNTNSTVTCQNSIFASSPNGGEVWGTLTDLGYNICSDSTANFSAGGSLNNTDPMLAPLANNGGPTATMAPLTNSPALNVIASGYPPVDQRGVLRPQGPAADIGALEAATGIILPPVLSSSYDGANIVISFSAQGTLTYRLLHSTDMHTWSSVDTNSRPTTGLLQFIQPAGPDPAGYFKVVTP